MNELTKRTTLSEIAYVAIRQQIITGRLAPSSKLVVVALASGLDLSPTPINEALAALERERLVTYLPHRGYFVSSVTPENVEEVYTVREVFELLTVRLATENADRATIAQLRSVLEQTRLSVRAGDTSRFSDLDLEFHQVVWNSARNALAARIGDLIGGQIRLLVATAARTPGRFRGAYEEHCVIYKAIKNRDASEAVRTMRQHIRAAKAALSRALSAGHDAAEKPSTASAPSRKS